MKFSLSFELLVERMQQLERLFIEWDGAFVWRGTEADKLWQIDGMIFDSGGFVRRIELTGNGPTDAWSRMLACFGWPQQRLLAHWLQWHCFEEITQPLQLGLGEGKDH